jgi:hypothetical protein
MPSTLLVKSLIALLGTGIIIFAFLIFKKKRKEIALLAVSIGIALIVCEFLVRIFLPQTNNRNKMFEYSPTLGWKFISNAKGEVSYPGGIRTLETNSMGFRDHTPLSHTNKKLLVLGDSFVSNISVNDDQVFTEIMEDQLKNFDVLNFGVDGYGQVQEYLLLDQVIKTIKPDVVILIVYVQNDFTDNVGHYWPYLRPYASLEGKDSTLVIHPLLKNQADKNPTDSRNIFSKSHLNTLITRGLNKLFRKTTHSDIPEFYLCQYPNSERQDLMFRIMGKLLLKIANLGKENDVPLVFALAPSIVQIEDELWASFLKASQTNQRKFVRSLPNDRLMEFAKRNNLLMLDLLPRLLQEKTTNVKLYSSTDLHWTKEGNRIAADALIDYLKSKSLIE